MYKIARLILLLSVLASVLILALAFFTSEDEESLPKKPDSLVAKEVMQKSGIPTSYARDYYAAAKESNLDWRLLAAIGFAETDHGQSPLPGVRSGINSAGCCAGVMQICVSESCGNVWKEYARDGDDDGERDPYRASDSIYTAANYLAWMKDFIGEDPRRLAAAYNAGPTLVAEEGIPNYTETQDYLRKVEKIYNLLEKKERNTSP